ncbi:hypothetical protein MAR_034626 [Mya arenaria]|uniref:Uncharacterized protein n=1 Tax=Mya arenaria TaxID=6604 RepID=A0ABY7EK57_MYAAR|nr:hypothetical protein MAR_034626 [Mya arenaria]
MLAEVYQHQPTEVPPDYPLYGTHIFQSQCSDNAQTQCHIMPNRGVSTSPQCYHITAVFQQRPHRTTPHLHNVISTDPPQYSNIDPSQCSHIDPSQCSHFAPSQCSHIDPSQTMGNKLLYLLLVTVMCLTRRVVGGDDHNDHAGWSHTINVDANENGARADLNLDRRLQNGYIASLGFMANTNGDWERRAGLSRTYPNGQFGIHGQIYK